MAANVASSGEPWLDHLHKQYLYCEEGTVEHDLAAMFKKMLLSSDNDGNDIVRSTAHQIDRYHWDRITDEGTHFRFQGARDIYDYLDLFYDIIITTAKNLRYDDAKQDTLIQLVFELRKIPPKPDRPPKDNPLVDPNDLLFLLVVTDARGDNERDPGMEKEVSPSEWKQHCYEWVNALAFYARCVHLRLDERYYDITEFPNEDMISGLEREIPSGTQRDVRVMIAAQYILLAGQTLGEAFMAKAARRPRNPKEASSPSRFRPEKWPLWARRFKELAKDETELAPEVKKAAAEAGAMMVSIHPDMFSLSEGGSKHDD